MDDSYLSSVAVDKDQMNNNQFEELFYFVKSKLSEKK
jgi:hypothetical protein